MIPQRKIEVYWPIQVFFLPIILKQTFIASNKIINVLPTPQNSRYFSFKSAILRRQSYHTKKIGKKLNMFNF